MFHGSPNRLLSPLEAGIANGFHYLSIDSMRVELSRGDILAGLPWRMICAGNVQAVAIPGYLGMYFSVSPDELIRLEQ